METLSQTTLQEIEHILNQQHIFFASHQTKDISFRIEHLKKFKTAVLDYEKKITDALWTDLHKSYEEAYLTEISIVIQEINNHIKHLKQWAKPKRVSTPIHLLPTAGKVICEPLGIALIVAPWNYPFQLLMNPLVGAISAGCCAVLKSSPYTPTVAKVMKELIESTFENKYIAMTQGDRSVNKLLLQQKFDHIFFTGSPGLGKIVMKAAAEHLTPVILELGGKSPCIVEKDADLDIAAKRIMWGKTINAGQTCIAPDYLFVHHSVKDVLIQKMIQATEKMYGKDVKNSKYYARIVNDQAMNRLIHLLGNGKIVYGGEVDLPQKYIHPTIIEDILPEYPVMQEEIFGPVLPVMTFDDADEAIQYINSQEKPLAFYYFGKNSKAKIVLNKTTSGGGCINDTLMHISNHHLPFGGVGNSGMGKYHGKDGFLAFSNQRAVASTPTRIDLPFKYPPFTHFKKIKRWLT
jgi:aldehyde dehydrogenase (NAD+)